ncbi:MAG: ParB/RepB/Spo0J family partition protein [Acidimicrobiaceae bacterium]|nr:ParB/RepB/Spo0J family partition protein [Acidimicrobiaceae bacterium]
MSRRSGLGRGLGALIPNEVVGDRTSALLNIPVAAIRPNPHQPRVAFDEEALAGLTASIRQLGVLQPILVRSLEEGVYELIAGERRWRAAKRAGLPTIPAICRNVDEAAGLEQALVENLHRQDLNPLEEAAAYQQLIEDFGLTHEQLSNRIGKSRAAITNTLRLFQLTPPVQKMVAEGQLSASHARALLGTPDRAFQELLARRVVTEQLSVRAVEEAVKERNELGGTLRNPINEPEPAGPRTEKLRPPGVLELEDLLAAHLDTRVAVELGNKRGKLTIDFADLEDLERIYRAMVGGAPST